VKVADHYRSEALEFKSIAQPPNGLYTHRFIGFPVGTVFDVTFSNNRNGQRIFMDPAIVILLASSEGETIAAPEPATLLLLGTGLMGIAIKTRKRLKTQN